MSSHICKYLNFLNSILQYFVINSIFFIIFYIKIKAKKGYKNIFSNEGLKNYMVRLTNIFESIMTLKNK